MSARSAAHLLLSVGVLCTTVVATSSCYRAHPSPTVRPRSAATCPAPAAGPRKGWRHSTRSAAVATLVGAPHHAANDPVINPGDAALARGKFAYGTLSKDLTDERVELWLRMKPCGPWRFVTHGLTDDDGRASLEIPAALLPTPGRYPFQMIIRGDLTRGNGTVFVVPRGIKAALFDVDGTLTRSDGELVKQLAYGKDPAARKGTRPLVRAYAARGYLPVYVTGRAYMLRAETRAWLRRHGYPPGPLFTTQNLSAARPGRTHVGAFKRDVLDALARGPGVTIQYAFGNAMTDVCAYAEAGIEPKRTYIFGENSGRACDRYPATGRIGDIPTHIGRIPPARIRRIPPDRDANQRRSLP